MSSAAVALSLGLVIAGLALVITGVIALGRRKRDGDADDASSVDAPTDATGALATGTRRTTAETTPPPGVFGPERLRVLVIDQDPFVGRAIARMMRQHETLAVTSGAAALATLATDDRFDAILCNLIMTDMTGVELAAAVSERHHDMRSRIVFMTGPTADAERFLRRADARWVTKPVRYAQLALRLSEVAAETRATGAPRAQTGSG